MGTNFYLHRPSCPHCKRTDPPIHIGKSSVGWTFIFRGYETDSPLGGSLVSFAAWRGALAIELKEGATIQEDYGREISLTDFNMLVERLQDAPNKTAAYMRASYPNTRDRYWVDEAGYSFSDEEFS